MENDASKAGALADFGVDVERVVVAAQTEDNSLFRRGLFVDDVVGLAVFGDRLALWRTRNEFGEFVASGLGSEIE
jgi:hypothetical protein